MGRLHCSIWLSHHAQANQFSLLLPSRLLALAYGFAFKMVSEIDWMSLNQPLARLLGLTVDHFNRIESAIFAALDYNIGVTTEDFYKKFDSIDQACAKTL